jgi:hypothetical protein
MDGQVRDSLQGSKISRLPLGLRRVAGAFVDDGGEVENMDYLVSRQHEAG